MLLFRKHQFAGLLERFAVFDKGDLVAFGEVAEIERSENETARKLVSLDWGLHE